MHEIRFKEESYTVDYAGFWLRLAAVIIDVIILIAVMRVIFGFWGMATGAGFLGSPAADPFIEVTGGTSLIGAVVWFLIVVAYFPCFWGWRGQTPGKTVMKIRITRFDGSHIGWSGAVMRFLSYIISLISLIGIIWIAFDDRRQGFHDKIADTFVIRIPPK